MDLMTLKETLGHSDIRMTSPYLAMVEQQIIEQQRKVNPLDQVVLPKSVPCLCGCFQALGHTSNQACYI